MGDISKKLSLDELHPVIWAEYASLAHLVIFGEVEQTTLSTD